jgi:hypothetical protein|mmetsp:Transcript_5680/g.7613  ORF Transcript_5680/g.7613 Transcript_5680/m.7613 type:complete len:88 (+) Transcript_5680:292-555(+)
MQGGANQYVLYPISSNGNSNHQGSEQTRASSGHAVSSSMNKSFDFVNNPVSYLAEALSRQAGKTCLLAGVIAAVAHLSISLCLETTK